MFRTTAGAQSARFSSLARADERTPGTTRSFLNPTNYFYARMPIISDKKVRFDVPVRPRIGDQRSQSTMALWLSRPMRLLAR